MQPSPQIHLSAAHGGADICQIAKNCRTSVEMIEKDYASHFKASLDAAAINVRKPRKGKPLQNQGKRGFLRRMTHRPKSPLPRPALPPITE